ncbi:SUMF1/EgtB/PvdO family nonheme iron enzyme [Halochromatium salexigens]|uniref:SUMF1/EgtB/PvdO family nonheme iron enzyme n=1 Tax=Halochromatium salexigens TaxID=49447 RepID=UPI0019112F9F
MGIGFAVSGWWFVILHWPLSNEPAFEAREAALAQRATELDRATFTRAKQTDTAAAYRAYLANCQVTGCAHRAQAEQRIAVLRQTTTQEGPITEPRAEAADIEAYEQAFELDTVAAYRAYLADCQASGCAYRARAEQRLGTLRTAAAQAARAAELAWREDELAQREVALNQISAELDQVAFAQAEQADDEAAYQAYLDNCERTGCDFRAQAETRLAQRAEQARRFAQIPEMVALKAGCFEMGSPPNEGGGRDEAQHEVCVDAFKIGKYEVTFSQYDRFAQATNRQPPNDEGWGRGNRPVINVSWEDASAYAAWLSETTGQAYRLPTEAEWEYAARAGTETPYYWGRKTHDACTYANVHDQTSARENGFSWPHHTCDDGYAQTAPVGQYQANAWELHDMLGNVWEWTCSAYDREYGGAEQRCASSNHSGSRAIRGSSWHGQTGLVRAAARRAILPWNGYGALGFRLAQD